MSLEGRYRSSRGGSLLERRMVLEGRYRSPRGGSLLERQENVKRGAPSDREFGLAPQPGALAEHLRQHEDDENGKDGGQ